MESAPFFWYRFVSGSCSGARTLAKFQLLTCLKAGSLMAAVVAGNSRANMKWWGEPSKVGSARANNRNCKTISRDREALETTERHKKES